MIAIVCYVPHKELAQLPWEALESHPRKEDIKLVVLTSITTPLGEATVKCDAIVARGLDAEWLAATYPEIPVIRIKINAFDILDSLRQCRDTHQATHIGIIGTEQMCVAGERLAELLNIRINRYVIHQYDSAEEAVGRAIADRCEAVVGGPVICRAAMAAGMKNGLIGAGRDSIRDGLWEAVDLATVMRQEHQRLEWLRQITENSKDGILVMNAARELVTVNKIARRIADAAIAGGLGGDMAQVFSFMAGHIEEVFASGREQMNILHELAGLTFSTNYMPVLLNSSVESIIITMVDILHLQQTESQIRNKLHAKGLQAVHTFDDYVHESGCIAGLIEKAKKMAVVDSTILITGESGTGKELLAQSIHNYSPRRFEPFVAVNCAALPENLLESELFGYSPGAFTGSAKEGKIGLFELAHKGTLFLDEITEMPLNFQSKLLRAIQESKIRRVGGDSVTSVDVRIIAATNRDPMQLASNGEFRLDLLFRLNVLQLNVPPLGRRRDDIIHLFRHYLGEFNEKFRKNVTHIAPEAQQLLFDYSWPGNVRELRNVAEQLCVLSTSFTITADDVYSSLYPDMHRDAIGVKTGFDDAVAIPLLPERDALVKALQEHRFNKADAARAMGMSRVTLWRKLKKYNIQA